MEWWCTIRARQLCILQTIDGTSFGATRAEISLLMEKYIQSNELKELVDREFIVKSAKRGNSPVYSLTEKGKQIYRERHAK